MCLAIPGKIKKIDAKNKAALVDFDGVERSVNISLVEVGKGDYVIVHAGYAIQKIDQAEALKTIKLYKTGKRMNQKKRLQFKMQN